MKLHSHRIDDIREPLECVRMRLCDALLMNEGIFSEVSRKGRKRVIRRYLIEALAALQRATHNLRLLEEKT
jgi:hypothetical protein